MMLLAYFLGIVSSVGCVWFGFWLGRMNVTETPSLPDFNTYEGEILDSSVYPFQVDE